MIARRTLPEVEADIPDEQPYWGAVTRHYPPARIALVDGDDARALERGGWPGFCACLRRYGPFGTYFWREVPDEIACEPP